MGRTVIDINEELLEKARELTGLKKKVDVVNKALEDLVKQKSIEKILELSGKVKWEGDIAEMRKDRRDTCRQLGLD